MTNSPPPRPSCSVPEPGSSSRVVEVAERILAGHLDDRFHVGVDATSTPYAAGRLGGGRASPVTDHSQRVGPAAGSVSFPVVLAERPQRHLEGVEPAADDL